jgi:CheY-like chemotaxis protein
MSDHALFLLVEDSVEDVSLLRRAFLKGKILNPLHVVRSGEEAIMYLGGFGPYSNRAEYPLPSLVLLDLKMPGMDGFEVLQWIRREPGIATLRVVVLTGSGATEDVNRAYKLGANSFLIKPADFEKFVEISEALRGYWLWMSEAPETARLPDKTVGLQRTVQTAVSSDVPRTEPPGDEFPVINVS